MVCRCYVGIGHLNLYLKGTVLMKNDYFLLLEGNLISTVPSRQLIVNVAKSILHIRTVEHTCTASAVGVKYTYAIYFEKIKEPSSADGSTQLLHIFCAPFSNGKFLFFLVHLFMHLSLYKLQSSISLLLTEQNLGLCCSKVQWKKLEKDW